MCKLFILHLYTTVNYATLPQGMHLVLYAGAGALAFFDSIVAISSRSCTTNHSKGWSWGRELLSEQREHNHE